MPTIRGQHLIGKVVGGCLLERLLGHGGSSAVFLGLQQKTGRHVAVKVFLSRGSMDAQTRRDFYSRFLREAEAASKLAHPHILPIYAYGEQEGLPYIIMPYMSGGTLSEYVRGKGALSPREALYFLEQICSALDYAHAHGCVHCDVKPANILLDDDGNIMLTDFGIARLARPGTPADADAMKAPDSLMGTPDYISPEQAMGRLLDGRSDIYSLGITLFFMLAKQLPFKADSPIALALLHIHELPPSLTLSRSDISRATDAVVLKALAKDPAQRFQTAGELSAAFGEALDGADKENVVAHRRVRILPNGHAIQSRLTVATPGGRPSFLKARSPYLLMVGVFLVILVGAGFLISPYFKSGSKAVTPPSSGLPNTINVPPTPTPEESVDAFTNQSAWPSLAHVFFHDDKQQYHVVNNLEKDSLLALYDKEDYKDFHLSINVSQVQGNDKDFYGVVLRCAVVRSSCASYYVFEINAAGQYYLWRYRVADKIPWYSLKNGSGVAFEPGKNNVLVIEAHGNSFSLSVNGKSLAPPITDTSTPALSSGRVGVYVEDAGEEVVFTQLHIKKL